ncbi:peptidylprolyl isomerase [Defluviimonas sp. WL0002]|uniref:Parvulin-like PPIase n=1 Tax=Albidovulum marisflavi TaxID=2984159 RepID=A0ABT2Z894_9RHOB|nr:peptidylprolyl isomerase [Defluviimonas sp. WL0002]MCV2867368.1 peptidylprolyl isomerase [Defluviimonas sp. WL0002]
MPKQTKLWAAALALALTGPVLADEPAADDVVATVNGTDITLGQMIALRDALPAQYLSMDDKTLFDGILEQLIQQTALSQEVPEPLSKRDSLTLDNQRLAYLANEALNDIADAAVTDEALQALYDEKYGQVDPGTEYHAAHILVATEEEAKAIREELDAGADFAALAVEKSTGPSGPNGGDLGWFGLGMMVAPFENAVVALEPGALSEPVQTQFGWHVIKLMETRAAAVPTLEEKRDELAGELQQQAVEAQVTALTEAAEITRNIEGMDPAILKNTALIDN